jgi:hypothetical protein
MTKEKKKRGRKALPPGERKSIVSAIRMTEGTKEFLSSNYGSVQVFFDNCVTAAREK